MGSKQNNITFETLQYQPFCCTLIQERIRLLSFQLSADKHPCISAYAISLSLVFAWFNPILLNSHPLSLYLQPSRCAFGKHTLMTTELVQISWQVTSEISEAHVTHHVLSPFHKHTCRLGLLQYSEGKKKSGLYTLKLYLQSPTCICPE